MFRSGAPWGSLVPSGSCGLRPVDRWFLLVCPSAPCRLLYTFGLVWFVRQRPEGRWVISVSSGWSRCALRIAGFVWVRLVRLSAPWGSLGSLGNV